MPNITVNTNVSTQASAATTGDSGSPIYPNGNYPYSTFGYDQFSWFLNDIARVNRAVTPWVIVAWHQPPYNSYSTHYKEFECGRLQIEPYLYANGVDIVLHGAACSAPGTPVESLHGRAKKERQECLCSCLLLFSSDSAHVGSSLSFSLCAYDSRMCSHALGSAGHVYKLAHMISTH